MTNPSDARESAARPAGGGMSPADLEAKAAEIEEKSPEGRPAHPETGAKQIGLMLALAVIVMLTVALIIAVTVSTTIGVVLGAVALAMLVFNPTFWTAVLRAQERG